MEMGPTTTTAVLLCCLCLAAQLHGGAAVTSGTSDGTELWGYITVRPGAMMFWWWYKSPQRVSSPAKPWPTILWLQGGPGGSSVGRGNFQEIGPLDVDLKPRNSTWLQMADLIFVDSPVGVGYSYVKNSSALATTDTQAAKDVVELIKAVVKEIPTLQSSPLYLVGESYGGKLAAIIGVSVARSIRAGSLNLTLGGVVLGNSWISPADFAQSYPWLLHSMSRLDDNAVPTAIRMGITVNQQMAAGQFSPAYETWTDLLNLTNARSGQVNVENIMIDNTISQIPSNEIMNGVIRKKLIIIPVDVMWQQVSLSVFDSINKDFMRPAIKEVDELLAYGVNVTVYNGQLDVICSTIGAESWLKKLK
ncbi:hypothetical protein PR202_gb29679 [Eleusine coracana subsp. coracana]|uniref:Carboxypeptidase n=1 Tax=Eleusine coracana subsp. coracana TaxID=191504 RepID=A0AAV5FXS2_ELECO|nr:hypothetical protein PR202_gb29679 [Eleusine coracana subsp. coracana]